MIKLTTKNKPKESFYFIDYNDCETFKRVFEDHWCHIKWKKPKEKECFNNMTDYDYSMLGNPKKLAEDNLSWAFNREDSYSDSLTTEEQAFIDNIVNQYS